MRVVDAGIDDGDHRRKSSSVIASYRLEWRRRTPALPIAVLFRVGLQLELQPLGRCQRPAELDQHLAGDGVASVDQLDGPVADATKTSSEATRDLMELGGAMEV